MIPKIIIELKSRQKQGPPFKEPHEIIITADARSKFEEIGESDALVAISNLTELLI